MFRLVSHRQARVCANLAGSWLPYATLEDARTAAAALLREERVQRVMIVRDALPMTFVEWRDR